ncbi:hypothetical protein LSM04_008594 [Trypanosoma melophagium]|uniref:uncharacterized protein n=1 Tax=Trypanosoma melophagium TaxID=715481 RepID=UPI00351A1B5C|nr:hypothetical protein LSM04_008594 [Trypanosoma melophagium]
MRRKIPAQPLAIKGQTNATRYSKAATAANASEIPVSAQGLFSSLQRNGAKKLAVQNPNFPDNFRCKLPAASEHPATHPASGTQGRFAPFSNSH